MFRGFTRSRFQDLRVSNKVWGYQIRSQRLRVSENQGVNVCRCWHYLHCIIVDIADLKSKKQKSWPDEGEPGTAQSCEKRTGNDHWQRLLRCEAAQTRERCFEPDKRQMEPTIFGNCFHLSTRRVPFDRVVSGNCTVGRWETVTVVLRNSTSSPSLPSLDSLDSLFTSSTISSADRLKQTTRCIACRLVYMVVNVWHGLLHSKITQFIFISNLYTLGLIDYEWYCC